MARKRSFHEEETKFVAAEINVKSKMADDGNRQCNICLQPVDTCRHKINYGIQDAVVEITPIEAVEYHDDIPDDEVKTIDDID